MFKNINKVIPKIGASDLVRGRTLFSEDIPLDNPIVLRVFRSKRAHAEIVDLDIEKALQIPGVIGVLTAADIPGRNLHGIINKDQPVLAQDRVRFVGEAIALVAAEDEEAAQNGINAIHININFRLHMSNKVKEYLSPIDTLPFTFCSYCTHPFSITCNFNLNSC